MLMISRALLKLISNNLMWQISLYSRLAPTQLKSALLNFYISCRRCRQCNHLSGYICCEHESLETLLHSIIHRVLSQERHLNFQLCPCLLSKYCVKANKWTYSCVKCAMWIYTLLSDCFPVVFFLSSHLIYFSTIT